MMKCVVEKVLLLVLGAGRHEPRQWILWVLTRHFNPWSCWPVVSFAVSGYLQPSAVVDPAADYCVPFWALSRPLPLQTLTPLLG